MVSQSTTTVDELIGLVAGTLNNEDFVRIAKAVKNDVALQAQLASLENIRSELISAMPFDKRQTTVEAFAEYLLERVKPSGIVRAGTRTRHTRMRQLHHFLAVFFTSARFTYSLVAMQAVGIAWLLSGALQTNDASTAGTRSAGTESKQLGVVQGKVILNISFDPDTPESAIRALLLELEAQIIAGPSQLGQYKIAVAQNRSNLALLKLRETVFVEQIMEIPKDDIQPVGKEENKK